MSKILPIVAKMIVVDVVGESPCLDTFTTGSLDTTQHIISKTKYTTKMATYL